MAMPWALGLAGLCSGADWIFLSERGEDYMNWCLSSLMAAELR